MIIITNNNGTLIQIMIDKIIDKAINRQYNNYNAVNIMVAKTKMTTVEIIRVEMDEDKNPYHVFLI